MEPIVDNQSTHVNVSPWKTGMRWGIIGGLTAIIVSTVLNLMKDNPMEKSWVESLIGLALMVTFVCIATKQHRDKDLGGYMSYGRGLGIGMVTGLFATILLTIFIYIFFSYFIDYETIANTNMEAQRDKMIERGMSDQQIESAMEWGKKFSSIPVVTVFMFVGYIFFYFIISLITSAIFKRNRVVY